MSSTPTFRLFVSSTFGDMKAEREILQARVFPKLRDYCKSKGAMFQAVDLRWGISEEAGLDQQTMNICLRELRRCQETTDKPNFLVLLGDRYGWLPLPPQIDALEFEELESVLTTESTEDTERLKRWYRRDENAVPAQYVLLPREGEFEKFGKWDCEEKAVRELLLRAIETAGWPAADPRREKYEHSATHQEIDAGALALPDPEDRVLACFRTITNLPEASDTFSDHYPDGTRDEQARQQLNDLRTALEDRIPKSHRYSYEAKSLCASAPLRENLHFDQDAFTDWVEESLRKIIDREIEEKQAKAADPLDQENAEHEAFGRERAHRFVGRKDLLDQIGAYLRSTDSGQTPFVVHGVSGTGKTALMGKAVLSQRHASDLSTIHNPQSAILLERYIAATPGSSNLRSLLVDLCQQLHREFGFEALKAAELAGLAGASGEDAQKQREAIEQKYGIPDDLNKLIEHFQGLPARVPDDRRLVLVLDALDQLDDEGNPHTLSWLPDRLPGNVRVVVSVLDRPGEPAGRAAESARLRFPDSLHEITPLATGDAGDLLDGWLADAGRALQPAQRQSVLRGFAVCGLPLWLKLVSEEAKTWHGWRAPEALPVTIPALLDHFLGELEEPGRHGPELVSTALSYLAAARNGLADEELLDVVALDDDYWTHFTATARREHRIPERRLPPVLWARLHGDLAFALAQRNADNATLHTFYHRQIAEAARRRYLESRSQDLHSRLGDYFNAQPHSHEGKPNLRKLSELVPQWIAGERWDDLIGDEEQIGPLTDLLFIQAKCEAGRVYDLVADYNAALAALPEFREENEWLAKRDAAMIAYNKALREYAQQWNERRNRLVRDENVNEPEPKLPEPVKSCEMWSEERVHAECERIIQMPTRRDRLEAFARFAKSECCHLSEFGNRAGFVIQHAFNHAVGGPVHDTADSLVASAGIPLLLRRWPLKETYNPKPILLWTLGKASERRSYPEAYARCVSVTPDGRRAVLGTEDHRLQVWDLENGRCLHTLEGHSERVRSVDLTPDGRRALSGSDDRTLRLWDLESGKCLCVIDNKMRVTSVTMTPDGRRAVTGGEDRSLRLWDLESRQCLYHDRGLGVEKCQADGDLKTATYVKITADGRHAVSGSEDHRLQLRDLESGRWLHTLEGHSERVRSVDLTPDGRRALSGSDDGTLRLWDLESGKCLCVIDNKMRVTSVTMTPDGRRAISSDESDRLRLWDLETGQCLREMIHHQRITCAHLTADGRRAIIGGRDATVVVLDMEGGQCLKRTGYRWMLNWAVTADGRRGFSWFGGAVGISRDNTDHNTVQVWDLEKGSEQCPGALEGHRDRVSSVSVTGDGQIVVSASEDKTLRVWDLETRRCLRTLEGHSDIIYSVSVTRDGRRAVSGGRDQTIRIWDLERGTCLRTLKGHMQAIVCVSVTPDGRRAVSSDFGTVMVWDLESGMRLHVLEGHSHYVNCVAVTPDGRYVVSGSGDKTLRMWDIETGQCAAGPVVLSESEPQVVVGFFSRLLDNAWLRIISENGPWTSVANSALGSPFVVISKRGEAIVYDMIGLEYGPVVCTAARGPIPSAPLSARCPLCGKEFAVFDSVVQAITSRTERLRPDQSRSLVFLESAFNDPGLLTNCPHCAKPLKFNPFFVDRG